MPTLSKFDLIDMQEVYSSKTESKAINSIVYLNKKGRIILDPSYQRGEVWQKNGKKQLIYSLLENMLIPPIIVSNSLGNSYTVIDGKQRLSTIIEFVNGEFYLDPKESNENKFSRIYFIKTKNNSSDINATYFTEDMREDFSNINLQFNIYSNLDDDQQRDIYERINYSFQLSPGETLKGSTCENVKVIHTHFHKVNEILQHLGIKNSRESNYLATASLLALLDNKQSFATRGKKVVEWIKNKKTKITNEKMIHLLDILKIVKSIYDDAFQYYECRNSKIKIKSNWAIIFVYMRMLNDCNNDSNKIEENVKYMKKHMKFLIHCQFDNEFLRNDEFDIYSKWNEEKQTNTNTPKYFIPRLESFNKFVKEANSFNKRPDFKNDVYVNTTGSMKDVPCPICKKHIISITNFECGHIISKNNGGVLSESNTLAICNKCNKKINSKDLDLYCIENKINFDFNKFLNIIKLKNN